jgi:hypothetical protein
MRKLEKSSGFLLGSHCKSFEILAGWMKIAGQLNRKINVCGLGHDLILVSEPNGTLVCGLGMENYLRRFLSFVGL